MKRFVLAPLLIGVAGLAAFAAVEIIPPAEVKPQPAKVVSTSRQRFDDGAVVAGEAVVTRGLAGNGPPAPNGSAGSR